MDYLYLIKCNEFYKIGITNDIAERFSELQVGNPYKLALVGLYGFPNALEMETHFHCKFIKQRVLGEWFQLSDSDISSVKEECLALGGVRKDWSRKEIPTRDEAKEMELVVLNSLLARLQSLNLLSTTRRNVNGSPVFSVNLPDGIWDLSDGYFKLVEQ
jgi:hypothetical protein